MRFGPGIVSLGLAAGLIAASPAAACSVEPGYRAPSALEMAEQAEIVLLGIVESGPLEYDSRVGAAVVVRPTALLKGASLPAEWRLSGTVAEEGYGVPSDPRELVYAHPQSFAGMCVRTLFVRGSTILLFLRRSNGHLVAHWGPFARHAEDVPSPDSRWVRAVRLYIEVAALPPAERRAALVARQAALAARTGDADAQAVAADIGRQLQDPNLR